MKATKADKILNWMAAAAGLYFVGTAIAGAIKRKREAEGVGKVERIKRRIYKEVSLAQQAGVDFSKKFPDLTGAEKEALVKVGEEVGWKQSKRAIESGKTYAESYYNSLRRAWNAVSGVEGIGRAYNVKDANGNVVLTWIEDAAAHVEAERRTLEAEARAAEARKSLAKSKRALTSAPAVKQPTKAELKAAAKEAEYQERAQFAENFINNWLQEHGNSWLVEGIDREKRGNTLRNRIINEFANKTLKYRKSKNSNSEYAIDLYTEEEGWSNPLGMYDNGGGQLIYELLTGWDNRYITEGFAREDLNDIRKALLDTAKLMQVYVDRELIPDKYVTEKITAYDRRGDKVVTEDRTVLWDPVVTGDERYKYLDYINYIVVVRQHYGNEDTYYPVRSYPDKESAENWAKGKFGGRNAKVYPVWEVRIESITGVSGIGSVSAADILEPELLDYIRENIDPDEVVEAMDNIDRYRYSLPMASYYVNEAIQELTNDWCNVNGVDPDDIWSVVDAEDILWAL